MNQLIGSVIRAIAKTAARPQDPRSLENQPAPVTACVSCHVSAKLQKGEALNERGHWLVDETVKRAAEEFDMAWLKDFPKNGQDLTPAPEAKYPT